MAETNSAGTNGTTPTLSKLAHRARQLEALIVQDTDAGGRKEDPMAARLADLREEMAGELAEALGTLEDMRQECGRLTQLRDADADREVLAAPMVPFCEANDIAVDLQNLLDEGEFTPGAGARVRNAQLRAKRLTDTLRQWEIGVAHLQALRGLVTEIRSHPDAPVGVVELARAAHEYADELVQRLAPGR